MSRWGGLQRPIFPTRGSKCLTDSTKRRRKFFSGPETCPCGFLSIPISRFFSRPIRTRALRYGRSPSINPCNRGLGRPSSLIEKTPIRGGKTPPPQTKTFWGGTLWDHFKGRQKEGGAFVLQAGRTAIT